MTGEEFSKIAGNVRAEYTRGAWVVSGHVYDRSGVYVQTAEGCGTTLTLAADSFQFNAEEIRRLEDESA